MRPLHFKVADRLKKYTMEKNRWSDVTVNIWETYVQIVES